VCQCGQKFSEIVDLSSDDDWQYDELKTSTQQQNASEITLNSSSSIYSDILTQESLSERLLAFESSFLSLNSQQLNSLEMNDAEGTSVIWTLSWLCFLKADKKTSAPSSFEHLWNLLIWKLS
jgi:hypothetical protein